MTPTPESPRPPINIILCSDGTGNSANKNRGTNVFKIYEAVDVDGHKNDPELLEQLAFYDDGVGTSRIPLLKALGGALGVGLNRNVRELYTHLVRVYQPGDKIFVFGFSRGAYTVRVLAGFIASVGIVDRRRVTSEGQLHKRVRKAYRIYRSKYRTVLMKMFLGFNKKAAAVFREKCCHGEGERHLIEFMGVWDTVDAVGLPWDGLATVLDKVFYPFRFPDKVMSAKVRKACHAVAIDDERKTFHPVMWSLTDDPEPNVTESGDPRIEQVWFAGVHSNVGGGYPKQGMSVVSLNWMVQKAKVGGLRFVESDEHRFVEHGNVHDKMYNSRAGVALYYRYAPRNIAKTCRKHGIDAMIHASALERAAYQTDGYAPGNIPFAAINPYLQTPLNGKDAFLDRVRAWVLVRQSAHVLLTVLSFVAVYFTFPDKFASVAKLQEFVASVSTPAIFGIVKELLLGFWGILFLTFFLLSFLARIKMEKTYAEGWDPIAPKILSRFRESWPWSNRNP